jgi:Methyltransferase FkbM domain
MEEPVRRIVRRLLAKTLRPYRTALRILRRGSIEKHFWMDPGRGADDKIASIKIEMMRLDQYAQRLGRIDFVKCDVEGAELLVLRGAQSTLRRCRPKLCLEIDDRWVRSLGWTTTEVFRYLRETGYTYLYGIDSRLTPLPEDTVWAETSLCSWEELRGLA